MIPQLDRQISFVPAILRKTVIKHIMTICLDIYTKGAAGYDLYYQLNVMTGVKQVKVRRIIAN